MGPGGRGGGGGLGLGQDAGHGARAGTDPECQVKPQSSSFLGTKGLGWGHIYLKPVREACSHILFSLPTHHPACNLIFGTTQLYSVKKQQRQQKPVCPRCLDWAQGCWTLRGNTKGWGAQRSSRASRAGGTVSLGGWACIVTVIPRAQGTWKCGPRQRRLHLRTLDSPLGLLVHSDTLCVTLLHSPSLSEPQSPYM